MIDIKFLRRKSRGSQGETSEKNNQDEKLPLVDEVIALDTESRKAKQEQMICVLPETVSPKRSVH